MKIGVSTYSFSAMVRAGRIDLMGIIRKTRDMGFDVLEFAGLQAPEGETPERFAASVREECGRVGLEIGNYTIGADFINGSGGDLNAEVERLKREIKIAGILGAPGVRHDATAGYPRGHRGARSFEAALPVLVKGCRAVTEFAAGFGIRTMVENHGFFCQDSERLEKLADGVNHGNFGILVDMGNFLCVDEAPAEAVGRLAPYAFHVHAKDFHTKPGTGPEPGAGWFRSRGGNFLRGAIIGHGDVPVRQCLSILREAGYDGSVAIEFEGMEDPEKGVEIGLENLRGYI